MARLRSDDEAYSTGGATTNSPRIGPPQRGWGSSGLRRRGASSPYGRPLQDGSSSRLGSVHHPLQPMQPPWLGRGQSYTSVPRSLRLHSWGVLIGLERERLSSAC